MGVLIIKENLLYIKPHYNYTVKTKLILLGRDYNFTEAKSKFLF